MKNNNLNQSFVQNRKKIPHDGIFDFTQEDVSAIMLQRIKNGTYRKFEEIDAKLSNIKSVCMSLLYDSEPFAISPKEIDEYRVFLKIEMQKLNKTKEQLKLMHYSWPITELQQSIDEFVLRGRQRAYVHESINGKLAKDITSALEQMSFCYGILQKTQYN